MIKMKFGQIIQWYADKYLLVNSADKKILICSQSFASSYGVNIPTTDHFKLPT